MIVDRIQRTSPYLHLKALYEKYERVLIPGTLVLGLVIDFITFHSIRIETFLKLLTWYLVVAGVLIAFMHVYDESWEEETGDRLRYVRVATPVLLQFAFGALLSASFLFYWFGGSIFVSWPFIVTIVFLLTANDVFREYYMKPVTQIGVYFFLLFTIGTILFPYALRSIDPRVFALTAVVAVVLMMVYVAVLSRFVSRIRQKRKHIAAVVLGITIFISGLYVSGLLPPIPLSVRHAGVYHGVERMEGRYELIAEQETFLERIVPGQKIHIQPGDPVYVFTAIYAPTDLDTTIYHRWQTYDEALNEWVEKDRLSFPIIGGRADGYRGYSLKRAVSEGVWRVDIETETEQVLDRIHFRIKRVNDPPETRRVTR
jgi:hypothetical protein